MICFAKKTASKIPDAVLEEVARALLPNILDYFASDRGKKEFEEWKKKKDKATKAANSEAPDTTKSEV